MQTMVINVGGLSAWRDHGQREQSQADPSTLHTWQNTQGKDALFGSVLLFKCVNYVTVKLIPIMQSNFPSLGHCVPPRDSWVLPKLFSYTIPPACISRVCFEGAILASLIDQHSKYLIKIKTSICILAGFLQLVLRPWGLKQRKCHP